jgi:hypothetical protein
MPIVIRSCQTIDEVIAQLDHIIDYCARHRSRLGFFATLYRNVTLRVRAGIQCGRFEDGPRMERLDVIFANRYFEALDCYWQLAPTPRCWQVAFQAAQWRRPIILQHLLLGMNAHINLDLAIAAIQTTPGEDLPSLKRDFYEITVLLGELIDEVQARIDVVSPWFSMIDRLGGRTDEELCHFAIAVARDLAWRTAEHLAHLPPEALAAEIARHDAAVAALGQGIGRPGWPLNMGLMAIRARERHAVPVIIAALKLENG